MTAIRFGGLRLDQIEDAGWSIEDDEPVAFRPREFLLPRVVRLPELLGRGGEVELAARAVRKGSPFEFYAPCGYGRTTLLRHLAARLPHLLGVPAVYLDTRGQPPEDLPQRIVREIVDTEVPTRATSDEARWLLDRVAPLVLLDDVDWSVHQTGRALENLAGCFVLLASDRPQLGERGRSRALPGLSREAALFLLGGDLGRALVGRERLAATRLADDLGGRPASLRQAAAVVRNGRMSLEELAERVRRDPSSLDRLGTSGLTAGGRRTLAALAAVGGAVLPADIIAVVSGVAQTAEALRELRELAIVDEYEEGFGLPRCAAEVRQVSLLSYLEIGAAVRDLADRLDQFDPGDVDGADVLAVLDAATTLVGLVAERRDWQGVIQLVRVLEPLLTIAGRWQTSVRILSVAARSASAVGDLGAQADFLHQSGTLAFGLGDLETARTCLAQALELRRDAADWVGAEVTERNMSRLTAIPAPPQPSRRIDNRRIRRRVPAVVAATVAVLSALGIVAVAGRSDDRSALTSPASTTTTPPPATSSLTTQPSTTSPTTSPGTTDPPDLLRGPVVRVRAGEFRVHLGTERGDARSFTVRNPNSSPLPLEPIITTGPPAFSATSDCPRVLRAAATCTGRLIFEPDDIGRLVGGLQVSDTSGHRTDIALTGVGYVRLTISRTYSQGGATEPAGPGLTVTATHQGRETTCPRACTVEVSDENDRTVTLSAAVICPNCDPRRLVLDSWSLPACGRDPTCAVTVHKDSEVTARFVFLVS